MSSLLDPGQIIKQAYDEAAQSIKVEITSGTVTTSSASVGATGAPAPGFTDQMGGVDVNGDLTPIFITAAQAVKTDSSATTQPVSGTVTVTQATGTNLHTVIDSGTITLPSGASTSALQTSGNASLSSIDGKIPASLTVSSTRLLVDGSGVIQPVSAASLPLPTGAATETTLSSLNTKIPASLTVSSTRLLVDGSGVTQPVSESGFTLTEFVRNDYTSVAVTTAAYTQLIASTTNAYKEVEIFDSSGQTLQLAIGGSGSEVNKILIFPGGNGRVKLSISASTRISIKAVSATASVGEIDINFYG